MRQLKKLKDKFMKKSKKVKSIEADVKGKKIAPEILCDIFKFLQKENNCTCQEVCWWWNQVILGSETTLPIKNISQLKYLMQKNHSKGKFAYFSEYFSKYIHLDSDELETSYFIMAKAYFHSFKLNFIDYSQAIPQLRQIVRRIKQPINVGCLEMETWKKEESPTYKDLPCLATSLESIFNGLVTADSIVLTFSSGYCIHRKELLQIAMLPLKMRWHFSHDPYFTITNEVVLNLIKNLSINENVYTITFENDQPDNFHEFLYESMRKLNGMAKKFSVTINFQVIKPSDYLLSFPRRARFEPNVVTYMKSMPKVKIEECEDLNTFYTIEEDSFIFQVQDRNLAFGFDAYYVIKSK